MASVFLGHDGPVLSLSGYAWIGKGMCSGETVQGRIAGKQGW
ncbi:hypothetical protein CFter6_3918 [Collimonas fungivorans]|uniref:Uncharacterized protein n=1 Tax=Collimonas fungivorans TaxID=158899 RepID=A0A127PFP3_9BURK|nr:hypothetical protein CFter6_3918 [Collimonas fungivorans]